MTTHDVYLSREEMPTANLRWATGQRIGEARLQQLWHCRDENRKGPREWKEWRDVPSVDERLDPQ